MRAGRGKIQPLKIYHALKFNVVASAGHIGAFKLSAQVIRPPPKRVATLCCTAQRPLRQGARLVWRRKDGPRNFLNDRVARCAYSLTCDVTRLHQNPWGTKGQRSGKRGLADSGVPEYNTGILLSIFFYHTTHLALGLGMACMSSQQYCAAPVTHAHGIARWRPALQGAAPSWRT